MRQGTSYKKVPWTDEGFNMSFGTHKEVPRLTLNFSGIKEGAYVRTRIDPEVRLVELIFPMTFDGIKKGEIISNATFALKATENMKCRLLTPFEILQFHEDEVERKSHIKNLLDA